MMHGVAAVPQSTIRVGRRASRQRQARYTQLRRISLIITLLVTIQSQHVREEVVPSQGVGRDNCHSHKGGHGELWGACEKGQEVARLAR